MAEDKKETPIEKLLAEIATEAESHLFRNTLKPNPEHAWFNKGRDKQLLYIMGVPLRKAAVGAQDYREFRQGLIEAAACMTIAIRRIDEERKRINEAT